jgi:hypothetical protein
MHAVGVGAEAWGTVSQDNLRVKFSFSLFDTSQKQLTLEFAILLGGLVSDENFTAQKANLQFLQMPLMRHLCHSYTETSSRPFETFVLFRACANWPSVLSSAGLLV